VAIGLNYMDHCREQSVPVPDRPLVFAKFTSSIIGPGEDIVWDPGLTQQVDYEAELGVIIGKSARNANMEQALDFVFGYTIVNDISARDLQFSDGQWVRSKSLDTFCPLGPVIVTADEIPDPQSLSIRCLVNGRYLQNSSTSEMIFGVKQLIVYLSKSFTLEPGDLVTTGTPNGVGVFRRPQIFLQDGDIVTVEIEDIGQLMNRARTTANPG
jgi:2-keto-4-pentenoate hydratase/2-oxohepta-3-ene-1,7-dioic acid hydratase in catechol pathway